MYRLLLTLIDGESELFSVHGVGLALREFCRSGSERYGDKSNKLRLSEEKVQEIRRERCLYI